MAKLNFIYRVENNNARKCSLTLTKVKAYKLEAKIGGYEYSFNGFARLDESEKFRFRKEFGYTPPSCFESEIRVEDEDIDGIYIIMVFDDYIVVVKLWRYKIARILWVERK